MANSVDNLGQTTRPPQPVVPGRTGGSGGIESPAASSLRSPDGVNAPAEAAAPAQARQRVSAASEQRASAQELARATANVSDFIQTVSRSLQISVDDELGSTVIRVLDAETDELVRQIPAEEVLAIARYLRQQGAEATDSQAVLKGVLLDRKS
jgi:flagellar protein FlaG